MSRINAMEAQLSFYMDKYKAREGAAQSAVDDLRVCLSGRFRRGRWQEGHVVDASSIPQSKLVEAQDEKHRYEMMAKDSMRRIMSEKHEAIAKLLDAKVGFLSIFLSIFLPPPYLSTPPVN